MTRLQVSIGINVVLAIVALGFGLKAMDPLPSAGITAGTVNPMIRINQAQTNYRQYRKTGASSALITEASDLTAAGGEMNVFGSITNHPNTTQLGTIISELGLDLSNPHEATEVFRQVQNILKYLPSNTGALNRYQANVSAFYSGATKALTQLSPNSNLYFK